MTIDALNFNQPKWDNSKTSLLTLPNKVASIALTALDLSAIVSPLARLLMVQVIMTPSVVGAGAQCWFSVRRNGGSQPLYTAVDKNGSTAAVGWFFYLPLEMDNRKKIQYQLDVGAGWTISIDLHRLAEWA